MLSPQFTYSPTSLIYEEALQKSLKMPIQSPAPITNIQAYVIFQIIGTKLAQSLKFQYEIALPIILVFPLSKRMSK